MNYRQIPNTYHSSVDSFSLHCSLLAIAPVVDAALTPNDAVDILEELLPAQNRSFELGLKLGLPHHEVVAIHSTYSDPRSRLLHVILAFLNQAEPRPTWRVIVDALRSPAVNLPRLADRVEATHFPDPTSTRDVVTETTSTGIKDITHTLLLVIHAHNLSLSPGC